MFTNESIQLRDYFFNHMNFKNSIDFQNLYTTLNQIKIIPLVQKKIETISEKNVEIDIQGGANNIIQKSYLFSCTSLEIKLQKLNVTLNIYSKNTIQSYLIDELLKKIQFVCSLSEIKIQHLVINLYLIDQKKKNTPKMKEFGPNEINSGMCQMGKITTITIYREEELFKVLIHELIHALRYDHYQDNDQIIKHYQNKYNLSSNQINTNEAYTEIWANLINCYLISQKVGRNQYNLFLILIALEKEFAKYQAQKIIYLSGIGGEKKIDINKNTNVLSYFIIRYEIYERLNLFLKFCRKNNDNYIVLKDEKKWFDFLKKNYKVKKNNRRFNNINKKTYLFSTMRMSLNEQDIYALT